MTEEQATNPVEGEDNAEAILPDTQEVDQDGQDEQPFDDEDESSAGEDANYGPKNENYNCARRPCGSSCNAHGCTRS